MKKLFIGSLGCLLHFCIQAQLKNDSLPGKVNLQQAVEYSLTHQPVVQQSLVDQEITEANIKSRLADWYPQLDFHYALQHNFKVQTAVIGGNVIKLGTDNTSAAQFTVSQTIFDRDVLLASSTRTRVRRQSCRRSSN